MWLRWFLVISMWCLLTFSALCVHAAPWAFPWLKITTRAERWAQESWRYFSVQGYKNWLERTRLYTDWLSGSGEDSAGEFVKRKAREDINAAREEFLAINYPEELIVDTTIKEIDGKYLLRGEWFHRKKAKIVLHHTVTRQVTTPEDAKASLLEMYKQHTITQGRWDIGYNFLLDPMGTIYEWRAWGKDVIGAHADRNNSRTIGVSLMGNYDVHEPSAPMRWSLKKLLLWLMLQYDIDPFKKQQYFTAINEEPWLVAATHTSLVGHSDTKNTACPWVHVENRLPELRAELDSFLKILQSWGKASLNQFRFLPKKLPIWMEKDTATAAYPFRDRVVRDCVLFGDGIALTSCGGNWEQLIVTVERTTTSPSGQYALLVDTDAGAVWIDVVVVWQTQLDGLLTERQRNHPLAQKPTKELQKIEEKISVATAAELMQRTMGVLLYEPTTNLTDREMQCESWCAVMLDNQRFADVSLIRVQPSVENPEILDVFLDLKKYAAKSVRLVNPRSVITMTNWQRGSTQYPLNYFRWDIAIQWQGYTTVDKKEMSGWTVVNHLPMELYLRGIAETVESQHSEKLRAMALLVKGYTLFYLWWNRHPSVPEGVTYQAIDDPRLFQKYVWAGIEQTTPLRQQAIEKTKWQVLTYEWIIPILPYFHCSAWFIRSGKERFWWTDTPWLVAQLDLATCESGEFEGHGVGLSGDGAERLAQAWATYDEIIAYYYPGVRLTTLP